VFVDLTLAYGIIWHRGLTWKLVRLLPDTHMTMERGSNRICSPTSGKGKNDQVTITHQFF